MRYSEMTKPYRNLQSEPCHWIWFSCKFTMSDGGVLIKLAMKKLYILGLLAFLFPISAFASFDTSLSYGASGIKVRELQEFLTDQGVYSGPITGNLFSLTRKGIIAFQVKYSINPTSGFFGPLTRTKANEILNAQLATDATQEVAETGTTTPQVNNAALIAQLQAQNAAAIAQAIVAAQNQQQTGQGGNNTPVVPTNPNPTPTTQPVDLCSNMAGVQVTVPAGYTTVNNGTGCYPYSTSVSIAKLAAGASNPVVLQQNATAPVQVYVLQFIDSLPTTVFREATYTIESSDFTQSDITYRQDNGYGRFFLNNLHPGTFTIKISALKAVDVHGDVTVTNVPFSSEAITIQ